EPQLVYEFSSTLTPGLPLTSPPLPLSRFGLARFNFAFAFVTPAALVLTLFNASTTLSVYVCKFWSNNQVLGGSQNGTFKTSKSCNISAQQLRLGQYTPPASAPFLVLGG
ncbi:hypothetical protein EDB89DRAFT_2229220, partial [Lactarius sanguifluus]